MVQFDSRWGELVLEGVVFYASVTCGLYFAISVLRNREIDKGKFAATDAYAYYEVIIDNKDVVVLTDSRIIYATKSEMFGGWQVRF